MNLLRMAAISALLASSFAIHNASALTIDQSTGANADSSAKFDDPDDKIPFPHIADDGSQSSGDSSVNFQGAPAGNGGISFGFTQSDGNDNAFQRAQDRMQQ